MTEAESNTDRITQDWEAILDSLRRRYPGNRDSTLFCIFKLQQNPDLGLRDLRDEATLHGLSLAGRSLHSARVLLGIEADAAAKPATAAAPAEKAGRAERRQRRRTEQRTADGSIEDRVLQAVRQIQDAAGARTQKLRTAIQKVIAMLQDAIDED